MRDWFGDPLQLRSASTRFLSQRYWSERIALRAYATWKEEGSHRDRCRKALQTPHSGAWLCSLPSALPFTSFEHCEYKVGLQWWLGLPLVPPDSIGSTCLQCGACLDAWGDHAVTCSKNGIHLRHSSLQEWLLHTAREAGITCSHEAALADGSRPADVLFHAWRGAGPLAVDVTVVHPLRPSEPRPTPDGVRRMLAREELAKCSKYQAACQQAGWQFRPLAFHPWGGCTPDGALFLHHLARLFGETSNHAPTKAERLQFFWQSLSCTLIRSVACQLRLTTFTGPSPPSLPLHRPTDPLGNELPLVWSDSSRWGPLGPKRIRASFGSAQNSRQVHAPYELN